MTIEMRYVTVGEKKTHEKIAKQYNIKGYSTSTFLMCSPSCIEVEEVGLRSKTAKKSKKKKASRR